MRVELEGAVLLVVASRESARDLLLCDTWPRQIHRELRRNELSVYDKDSLFGMWTVVPEEEKKEVNVEVNEPLGS